MPVHATVSTAELTPIQRRVLRMRRMAASRAVGDSGRITGWRAMRANVGRVLMAYVKGCSAHLG
jgi:hypothetical protein